MESEKLLENSSDSSDVDNNYHNDLEEVFQQRAHRSKKCYQILLIISVLLLVFTNAVWYGVYRHGAETGHWTGATKLTYYMCFLFLCSIVAS
jgi:hypothetical protein